MKIFRSNLLDSSVLMGINGVKLDFMEHNGDTVGIYWILEILWGLQGRHGIQSKGT